MEHDDMIQFIEEAFEENYELLKLEGGHALAPNIKQIALDQVKNYWKKMKDLAENVSDTEIRLTLPHQKTSTGRNYTIQGVVDVVKKQGQTTLYDIKTHDVDYVRSNQHDYEGQLNIYAYIWQSIRGERMDATSIIATGETSDMRNAKKRYRQTNDEKHLIKAFESWDPLVNITLSPERLAEYLSSFAEVVECIEEHQFQSPPIEKLNSKVSQDSTFAVRVCSNCDVRFSCESYKEYAYSSPQVKRDFLNFFTDYGTEDERTEVIEASLEEEVE